MKIGNLLVNAAYLGERVLTAIAFGATNWSAYADRIKPLSEYVEPTNE